MSNNQSYLNRSLQAVWHPCTQMKQHESLPLIPIQRGAGVWLYDFEGKRYLDAISSWWVNLFGHANPHINAALQDQLQKLEHVILAGFTHEPVIELSEALIERTHHALGHCFYASDGASAVEIALKMSFQYWHNQGLSKKSEFISLANSYHGETLGALGVTDIPLFKSTYAPLLKSGRVLPNPDWRLAEAGETPIAYAVRCAQALEIYLQQHAEQTAAFIIEPLVQCANGMAMYHPYYLTRAAALCQQYHVHLIADEIAVGFGRTGSFFAYEQAAITPDFLCLSKGISGGYLPLSVVMLTPKIFQGFYHDDTKRGFLHSHSYTGNALACRAALATLELFEGKTVLQANRLKAEKITDLAQDLIQHPKVRHFRQSGMIWAFEVETKQTDFARKFYMAALQNELLLRPIGKTIYFMPPYIIDEEESRLLVEGTIELIDQIP